MDLVDGHMRIFIHKEADHAVSVTHPFEFTNGTVKMRFKLQDAKDTLGLNFADLGLKTVHAGHLCMAIFSVKDVLLRDLKTGVMDLQTYEQKKAGSLPKEALEALKLKEKSFPTTIAPESWHSLIVTITGDTITAAVDAQSVGSFSSPGIAHGTKKMLRLSVPKTAIVDDIEFYRANWTVLSAEGNWSRWLRETPSIKVFKTQDSVHAVARCAPSTASYSRP